jgi:hypothetical protein
MKEVPCKYLASVREAVRSGGWDAETRRHYASCPDCRQEVQVRDWLLLFAQEAPDEMPPASPHLIWLKAQLAEKQEAQKRALRPLVYLQIAAQMFIGVAFIIALAWNWPAIQRWLQNLTSGSLALQLTDFNSGMTMVVALFFFMILLSLGVLMTFNTFADER